MCLPKIGSFVNVYQSAFVDLEKYSFIPPTKTIAFNPQLKEDDGLLSNFIAEKEQLSEIEAKALLKVILAKMCTDLENNKQVVLPSFGILQKGIDGNSFFIDNARDNFLEEAYGLQAFNLEKAIEQEELPEPTIPDELAEENLPAEEIVSSETQASLAMRANTPFEQADLSENSNEDEVPETEETEPLINPLAEPRGFRIPPFIIALLVVLLLLLVATYGLLLN